MVPRLHQCNGYIKRKLRAWRVKKCIALVGTDIALTSAGPQTTPCHGGQYRVHQGNMRNFGPTNTHGTASAPMQWLYEKEATGMESSKMYCPSRCRCRIHQCGAANYPVSWGAVQGPPRKYEKLRAYQYPWYRVCTNAMVISKGRHWCRRGTMGIGRPEVSHISLVDPVLPPMTRGSLRPRTCKCDIFTD